MRHNFFMRRSSLVIASYYSLKRRSREGAPYQSVGSSMAGAGTRCARCLAEGTGISANSLRRNDTEVLGRAADARALLRDIGSEIGRPAEIGDLPAEIQPFLDHRINGLPNIGGDAVAES